MIHLDRLVAAALLVAGIYHAYTMADAFLQFGAGAAYFFLAGITLMLAAALNLLRIEYPGAAGVRWVSIAANVVLLAFTTRLLLAVRANIANETGLLVVGGLLLAATVLSVMGRRGGGTRVRTAKA